MLQECKVSFSETRREQIHSILADTGEDVCGWGAKANILKASNPETATPRTQSFASTWSSAAHP